MSRVVSITGKSSGLGQSSISSNISTELHLHVIGVDTTGGVVTVTLSTATVIKGQVFIIKDEGGNAGSNNISIVTEGSETIDGASSDTISSNFGSVGYYCDGYNWFKV